MEYELKLIEEERQLFLLALAELALSRPGFDHALKIIAAPVDPGLKVYSEFKGMNADRVHAQRMPLVSMGAQQDEEEIQRWLFGVANNEPNQAGDFLKTFVAAALRADAGNYPILRPAVMALKQRFPKYRFSGEI